MKSSNRTALRVAVVSSPRSGNSWIRSTLAGCLDAHDLAFHRPTDAPDKLPSRCIVQIHWDRTDEFLAWLTHHKMRVMTIARHPLDVLLSAVRYGIHARDVREWLEGETGLPVYIPGSGTAEFLEYCLSKGASRLLGVTPQWWQFQPAIKVRYEDFVSNPPNTFESLLHELGGDAERLPEMLRLHSLKNMRRTPNRHGWRGEPGHWTRLIASRDAQAIYERHADVFRVLSYPCIPYVLSRAGANRNWNAILT